MRAVVLDFDGSVRGIEADVIPLRHLEEEIRFGCRLPALDRVRSAIPREPSIAFIGSGDFHHVSFPLIANLERPVEVVVFDNHPDNMRYPFGIHCGSWVAHVARLPFVQRVHVVGITSSDVEGLHVAENRLRPLREGRVVYWCVGRDLRWLRRCGVRASRSFDSVALMLDAFLAEAGDGPLYLSIDKDVLAAGEVQTNWDQGVMRLDELAAAIASLRDRVIAADITGEISSYRYRSRWKRFLSRLDAQPVVDNVEAAQLRHAAVNRQLLDALLTR